MRIKILTLFVICFSVVAGVYVWRLDHSLFEDRLVWNEAQLKNQMATLDVSLASFISQLKSEAQLLEPERLANREFKKDFILSEGRESQWLMDARFENSEEGWKAAATTYLEGSQVQSWALNYSLAALKNVKAQDILNSGHYFMTILDPQRKSYLLFAWPASNGEFGVALFRPLVLQNVVDSQKGQWAQAILANTQGQIIAHSVPGYVATQINEDPLLGPIVKNENQFNSVIVRDSENTAFQFISDNMTKTNLRMIFQTPVADLMAGRTQLIWQNLSLAIGVILIGSALIFFLFPNEAGVGLAQLRAQTLSGISSLVQKPQTQTGNGSTGAKPVVQIQKEMVYQTVAPQVEQPDITHLLRSIVREVSEPLHAILSRVQLLKSHDNSTGYAQQIEEEVQKSRDLLNLLDFSTLNDKSLSNPSIKKFSVPFAEHLKTWLEAKKVILETAGVKLQTGIETDFEIEMDPYVFNLALDQIFYNALESMQNQSRKELVLKLFKKDDRYQLTLQDTGEGIPDRNMQQIFNPFFTSKGNQKPAQALTLRNRGLGLPAASGVFNFHRVKFEIQSQVMKGTTVILTFAEVLSQSIVDGESTSIYRVSENKSLNDRTVFKAPGSAKPVVSEPVREEKPSSPPAASAEVVNLSSATPIKTESPILDLLDSDPISLNIDPIVTEIKKPESIATESKIDDIFVNPFAAMSESEAASVASSTNAADSIVTVTHEDEVVISAPKESPQKSKGGLDSLLKKKAGLLFKDKTKTHIADEAQVKESTVNEIVSTPAPEEISTPVISSEVESILDEDPFSEKSTFLVLDDIGLAQSDSQIFEKTPVRSLLSATETEDSFAAPAEPEDQVIQLDLKKKTSKLDNFAVMVRKPRKNNDASTNQGGAT